MTGQLTSSITPVLVKQPLAMSVDCLAADLSQPRGEAPVFQQPFTKVRVPTENPANYPHFVDKGGGILACG